MPNSWSKIHSRWKHRIFWERSQQIREVSGYSYREKDQNCHLESLKEKGKRNDIYSNLKFQLSPDCLTMSISLFWEEFCSVSGRDPFNQNSNRSDREKWSTSKGGPVFSKLFLLDRTDPLSFGTKFPEILVEWIAPSVSTFGTDHFQDLRSKIFRARFIKGTTKFLLDKNSSCTMIRVTLEHKSWPDSSQVNASWAWRKGIGVNSRG